MGIKEKTPEMCGKKAPILQQHFNVSKNQLLALASLFSESDQVTLSSLILPFSFLSVSKFILSIFETTTFGDCIFCFLGGLR